MLGKRQNRRCKAFNSVNLGKPSNELRSVGSSQGIVLITKIVVEGDIQGKVSIFVRVGVNGSNRGRVVDLGMWFLR